MTTTMMEKQQRQRLQLWFCWFHYVTGIFTFGMWSLKTRFMKRQSKFFDYRRRILFDYAWLHRQLWLFFNIIAGYQRILSDFVWLRWLCTWALHTGPHQNTNIVQGTSRFKKHVRNVVNIMWKLCEMEPVFAWYFTWFFTWKPLGVLGMRITSWEQNMSFKAQFPSGNKISLLRRKGNPLLGTINSLARTELRPLSKHS